MLLLSETLEMLSSFTKALLFVFFIAAELDIIAFMEIS